MTKLERLAGKSTMRKMLRAAPDPFLSLKESEEGRAIAARLLPGASIEREFLEIGKHFYLLGLWNDDAGFSLGTYSDLWRDALKAALDSRESDPAAQLRAQEEHAEAVRVLAIENIIIGMELEKYGLDWKEGT